MAYIGVWWLNAGLRSRMEKVWLRLPKFQKVGLRLPKFQKFDSRLRLQKIIYSIPDSDSTFDSLYKFLDKYDYSN